MVNGVPAIDAIGGIKYPKENETFHTEWNIPEQEFLIDRKAY